MKKFIAFTLMLVLILACLAPAIAATAELTAMSHGGTAQTAATSNYTFSGTGPRTVYYLNADGFNAVDSSFFARVQTQSAQTTSVTINFSWAP